MEHIRNDDILQIGLGLLKNMGEHMGFSSNLLYFFRCFNITVLSLNLFFILSNLAHVEGAKYIKTTECALTISHVSKIHTNRLQVSEFILGYFQIFVVYIL